VDLSLISFVKPADQLQFKSVLTNLFPVNLEDQKMYAEQIIMNELISHMKKYDGKYQDWYAGVTADAREMLFSHHGVKENGDAWISRRCVNNVAAREIERYFMKKGCKGGAVSEEKSILYFYAYMIQPHTRQ
jgi:hypothetical protein